MIDALTILQAIVSFLLIIVVLLQFGKGAELGATMGGGASQGIFSSSQQGSILTKITTLLATLFLTLSIALSYFTHKASDKSLFDSKVETKAAALGSSEPEKAEEVKAEGNENPADTATPAAETAPETEADK